MNTNATSHAGKPKWQQWIPAITLMFSAFVFNTSEFIPIGLLSDIGADFGVDEAKTGMIISVYAWVVALMSLPLMVAMSGIKGKTLMLILVGGFSLFQFTSALSPGYWSLMVSRIGVACTHAVFWGVVPLLAVRTAPQGRSETALSIVVSGGAIAMIVGLPLGRVIGLFAGWRTTFAIIGAVGVAVTMLLLFYFPRLESTGRFSVKKLPELFHNKLLLSIFVYVTIIVTAYFTAYAYIEPFLLQVASLPAQTVTALLVAMGFASLTASIVFARWYRHAPRTMFLGAASMLITALAMLHLASGLTATICAFCFLLSGSLTLFNLINQEIIVKHTPAPGGAVAMATYSGLFNLGIGSGTYLGGLAITLSALPLIGYIGAAIGLLGLLFGSLTLLRRL